MNLYISVSNELPEFYINVGQCVLPVGTVNMAHSYCIKNVPTRDGRMITDYLEGFRCADGGFRSDAWQQLWAYIATLELEHPKPLDAGDVVPPEATYQHEMVNCGKDCCNAGAKHGPYWYAYWSIAGKTRKRYIGKERPAIVAKEKQPESLDVV